MFRLPSPSLAFDRLLSYGPAMIDVKKPKAKFQFKPEEFLLKTNENLLEKHSNLVEWLKQLVPALQLVGRPSNRRVSQWQLGSSKVPNLVKQIQQREETA